MRTFRQQALAAVCMSFALLLSMPSLSAAQLTPDSINSAAWSKDALVPEKITALGVRVQVLLERAHFSPGEIDGKYGENTRKALRAYAEAQRLASSDELTEALWQKLSADNRPVLAAYTITAKDVAGPFLAKLPSKMEELKHFNHLNFANPREELAERFHMSEELLSALNPDRRFDRDGVAITVVDVGSASKWLPVERLEIDKQRQTVKAFDRSGNLVAFYPATVGSEEKPSPSGRLKVVSIHFNPTYRYNPDYHFKGVHSKTAFTIAPGPNNPVGTVWISLSAEGYGIHGTPNPSKVSKAESHGCVRLTNWDAEQLAGMLRKGVPVDFI